MPLDSMNIPQESENLRNLRRLLDFARSIPSSALNMSICPMVYGEGCLYAHLKEQGLHTEILGKDAGSYSHLIANEYILGVPMYEFIEIISSYVRYRGEDGKMQIEVKGKPAKEIIIHRIQEMIQRAELKEAILIHA